MDVATNIALRRGGRGECSPTFKVLFPLLFTGWCTSSSFPRASLLLRVKPKSRSSGRERVHSEGPGLAGAPRSQRALEGYDLIQWWVSLPCSLMMKKQAPKEQSSWPAATQCRKGAASQTGFSVVAGPHTARWITPSKARMSSAAETRWQRSGHWLPCGFRIPCTATAPVLTEKRDREKPQGGRGWRCPSPGV